MAQGEEQPDAGGLAALADQLACGVVDGGDVVGVEGVPQPENVGGESQSDTEDFPVDVEVARDDEDEQRSERQHVQTEDDQQGPTGRLDDLPGAG